MSEKRLLEIDPITGTKSVFEYDESEDRALIHETTDVTAIIEDNKARQNDGTGGWNADKTMRHAAHIPFAVIQKWRELYGVDVMKRDHMPAVKRLLNDPEWQFLRTGRFKL